MNQNSVPLTIQTPAAPDAELFSDAAAAVDRLEELYRSATRYLTERFSEAATGPCHMHATARFIPKSV